MGCCYVCNEELTKDNLTEEHIILNSLGGKLKSTKLICKKCNSSFGDAIDAELSNQLNVIANLINIKRDRGEPPNIIAQNEANGDQYLILPGGKPLMLKPNIKVTGDEEKHFEILVKNIKEAKQVLNGLKRKYPQIDVNAIVEESKVTKEYMNNKLTIPMNFGGNKVFRSICKTAINFYMHNDGKKANIIRLLPYVKDGKDNRFVCSYYIEHEIINKMQNEILHSIILFSDISSGKLICYIELFNAYKYVVLLNDNYEGDNINKSYIFDVIKREVVNKKINTQYLKVEDVEKYIREQKQPDKTIITNTFSKLINIVMNKQETEHIHSLTENALNNSLKKYPEGCIITPEMNNELVEELMKEITPWIINKLK